MANDFSPYTTDFLRSFHQDIEYLFPGFEQMVAQFSRQSGGKAACAVAGDLRALMAEHPNEKHLVPALWALGMEGFPEPRMLKKLGFSTGSIAEALTHAAALLDAGEA